MITILRVLVLSFIIAPMSNAASVIWTPEHQKHHEITIENEKNLSRIKASADTILVGKYIGKAEDFDNNPGTDYGYLFYFEKLEVLKGEAEATFAANIRNLYLHIPHDKDSERIAFDKKVKNIFKEGSKYLIISRKSSGNPVDGQKANPYYFAYLIMPLDQEAE